MKAEPPTKQIYIHDRHAQYYSQQLRPTFSKSFKSTGQPCKQLFFCLIPRFFLKQSQNCYCLIFGFLHVSTKKYAAEVKCTDLSLNLIMDMLSKPTGSKHETLTLYLSSLGAFIFKKKKKNIYFIFQEPVLMVLL